jgi:hypothetical protein
MINFQKVPNLARSPFNAFVRLFYLFNRLHYIFILNDLLIKHLLLVFLVNNAPLLNAHKRGQLIH